MDKSLMQKIVDCANDEYDFYGKSEKFIKLQKAVFKTGDKTLITYFMQNVYGAEQKPIFDGVDFEALEDAVMNAKVQTDETTYLYRIGSIIGSNASVTIDGFNVNFSGVDFGRLQDRIAKNSQETKLNNAVYCVCLDGEMGDLSRVCNMKRHGKQIDELIVSLSNAEEELER